MPHEPTVWELAVATNAAFKGLLASTGESGSVCARVVADPMELDTDRGFEALCAQIADELARRDAVRSGDSLVVADKVVALAQGRIGPREAILEPDPKKVPSHVREELAARWTRTCGFPVTPFHLLVADEHTSPDGRPYASFGTEDPNAAAAALAAAVSARCCGVRVDVVVSDTDTGIDVLEPLIGTVTIAATPIGCTAGLTLYESMRCACAAEFVRGHRRRIPVVVCKPAERCATREGIGRYRGYAGPLDARRERGLTYG